MANPSRRGQVAGPVSGQMRGDEETPFANTSAILPYGLQLRQTINAGTTSVTIPAGITFVYAIAVGGGGGGGGGNGGGAGGIAWGWTLATSSCIVGEGGLQNTAGNYTRYGNIIAGAGGGGNGTLGVLGGGGGANVAGGTNYYGIPGGSAGAAAGVRGNNGSGAGGGVNSNTNGGTGGAGGDGISGGGGGTDYLTLTKH